MQGINRGDIFYADLNGTVGSEQAGIRLVIITQNEVGNKFSSTVIVVPLTKKIGLKIHQPTHYWLRKIGKLKFDSIALTEQIRVIDKRRLKQKIGVVNDKIMKEIDKKIIIALGISKGIFSNV